MSASASAYLGAQDGLASARGTALLCPHNTVPWATALQEMKSKAFVGI